MAGTFNPQRRGVARRRRVAWGTNWPVTKLIVQDVTPLWATALRCMIAAVILAPMLWVQGILSSRGAANCRSCSAPLSFIWWRFRRWSRPDCNLCRRAGRSCWLHDAAMGRDRGRHVPVGSDHAPARDRYRLRHGRPCGIFNPQTLNWGDRNALFGSGLILIAAFCWAGNIVYVRAHKWISTPFQLVFWQILLAAGLLSIIAWFTEGPPHIEWTARFPS